jgi:hypothetical protein
MAKNKGPMPLGRFEQVFIQYVKGAPEVIRQSDVLRAGDRSPVLSRSFGTAGLWRLHAVSGWVFIYFQLV